MLCRDGRTELDDPRNIILSGKGTSSFHIIVSFLYIMIFVCICPLERANYTREINYASIVVSSGVCLRRPQCTEYRFFKGH